MNVSTASKLEAAQQPLTALKSTQESNQAAQINLGSKTAPFLAILKWSVRGEDAATATESGKKKTKPSTNSDSITSELPRVLVAVKPPILLSIPNGSQTKLPGVALDAPLADESNNKKDQLSRNPDLAAIAALAKSVLAVSPPIVLSIPNGSQNTVPGLAFDAPVAYEYDNKRDKLRRNPDLAAIAASAKSAVAVTPAILLSIPDILQPKASTETSNTLPVADGKQASAVQQGFSTTPPPGRDLMAFSAMLTAQTPGPENSPAPIRATLLTQAFGDGPSAPKLEVSPEPVKASGKAEPIRPTEDTPQQHQEEHAPAPGPAHSKDTPSEKQPEVLHIPEQQTRLQTVSGVSAMQPDKGQIPSPRAPVRPDPPNAELKTETNATIRPPPAREISLKLAGGESGSVDLRISERAGKIHVDVRTPDGNLARSLRTDLGELVGRLEKRGFETETWTPGAQATAPKSGRSGANPDNSSEHDPSGGGQPNQREHQQGRPRQHSGPDWVEQRKTGNSFEEKIKEIHDNIHS